MATFLLAMVGALLVSVLIYSVYVITSYSNEI
jgi:hypothetical protein